TAKWAIDRMNEQRAQVPSLMAARGDSPQFEQWWRQTRAIIARLYGERSRALSEFASINFVPPILMASSAENALRQSYLDGLQSIDTLLSCLIHEIETFGVEVLPVIEQELKHRYTGLFGAKVFWLATLTLLPTLIALK